MKIDSGYPAFLSKYQSIHHRHNYFHHMYQQGAMQSPAQNKAEKSRTYSMLKLSWAWLFSPHFATRYDTVLFPAKIRSKACSYNIK